MGVLRATLLRHFGFYKVASDAPNELLGVSNAEIGMFELNTIYSLTQTIASTYDHRNRKTRYPVRSTIFKPVTS